MTRILADKLTLDCAGDQTTIIVSLSSIGDFEPSGARGALFIHSQGGISPGTVFRSSVGVGEIGTCRIRRHELHGHTIVRENPAPEPTISTSTFLLIQGGPEERPIYLGNFHIICLLMDLSQSRFG